MSINGSALIVLLLLSNAKCSASRVDQLWKIAGGGAGVALGLCNIPRTAELLKCTTGKKYPEMNARQNARRVRMLRVSAWISVYVTPVSLFVLCNGIKGLRKLK